MAYRLIIEENTIYEIDEECAACVQMQNRNTQNRNQDGTVLGSDSFENRKQMTEQRNTRPR